VLLAFIKPEGKVYVYGKLFAPNVEGQVGRVVMMYLKS
jgi:hypothetical protein